LPVSLNWAPHAASGCICDPKDCRFPWDAPTTSPRDKKELLRAVLEEVIVSVQKQERRAHLTLRWRGGALTDTTLDLPRLRPAIVRTDEDTIALVRRLAAHYPDTVIAGILNRQGRTSAYGHRFDANNVGNLRRHWKIPRFRPSSAPADGESMTIRKAAAVLGVAPSTIHRAINDGAIVGEQITVGAPWRIRLTDELRARFTDDAPSGYFTMYQAMRRLGVSRQTVWQRVICGRPPMASVFWRFERFGRLRSYVRPVCAEHISAGLDEVRLPGSLSSARALRS
jgi:predicted DNA-binding protein (UPF0251 family)